MNFKKRVNGSWTDTPHYIHKTATDTITTLPAVIYPNAATATVGLKGNMSQSGTPTPQNPIHPQECGEKTRNLFDKSTNIVAYYLTQTTGVYSATSSTSRSALIPCKPSTTYTIHVPTNRTLRIVEFAHYPQAGDAGSNYTSRETGNYIDKDITVTTTSTAKYLCVFCYNSPQETTQYIESEYFAQVMIIEGSPAPSSYIPYGYKIPISSTSTTTPIYLGEVESTRRIKKYEFTGQENISQGSENYYTSLPTPGVPYSNMYCTHNVYGACSVNNNGGFIWFKISSWSDYTTAGDLKAFFQQEYAAGTPVCIWYVLATPETGIVNEPLMCIGDYADEVSGISIPVTAGGDTLSVDTTVQPSEVTVNYKGWYPAIVHERTNGAWT